MRLTRETAPRAPWNKDRTVGKKKPLTAAQVELIRMVLRQENNLRDLALFNLAIDTLQSGCDIHRLRVADVATSDGVLEEITYHRQKTKNRGVKCNRPVYAALIF